MLKIDNTLLEEIGLGGLPEVEKNSFLKHVYETLEMRVGIRLADQMTNDQLDEFEQYFEAKDDAGAFKWLETNFPNYKDIVQEEFDKLKAEVAQTAPQILSASQAAQVQAGQQPAAAPPPPPQNPYPPAAAPSEQPPLQPYPQDPAFASPASPPAPAPAYTPGQPAQFAQPAPAPPQPQPLPPQPSPLPQPPQALPPAQQPYQPPPGQPPYPPQQPPPGPPQN